MIESKEISVGKIEEQKRKSEILIDLREKEGELPLEVDAWLRKIEKVQPKQIDDDQTGQPLLTPTSPVSPVIIIPISRKKFAEGFKAGIEEATRWLSEFVFRMIKIKKGGVKFKEE